MISLRLPPDGVRILDSRPKKLQLFENPPGIHTGFRKAVLISYRFGLIQVSPELYTWRPLISGPTKKRRMPIPTYELPFLPRNTLLPAESQQELSLLGTEPGLAMP
jgi:hypothetical protein